MLLSRMKLSTKIPLTMLVLAALNALITSGVSIYKGKQEAERGAQNFLAATGKQVSSKLETYLGSIEEDLVINADSDFVQQAIIGFDQGWDDLQESDKSAYLTKIYIDDNPNKVGEKHLLDAGQDGSLYSQMHAKYHPWFRELLTQRDYYDIFLFDKYGNVIYTVYKEHDFATNVVNGPWKDTDLGQLFRDISKNPKGRSLVFYDFKPYAPSNNVPAAFAGISVLQKDGTFIGVLAFQMPIGRINTITQLDSSISETSRVHLIGPDFLVRNDPDLSDKDDPILKEKMDNPLSQAAFKGGSAIGWEGSGADKHLATYSKVHVFDKVWLTNVNMDSAEALAASNSLVMSITISTVVILLVVAFISVLYARSITGPINSLMGTMKELANRNYKIDVPYIARGDELGDMARAVSIFKENGQAIEKLQAEQAEAERRAELDKRAAMNKLASDFENRVSGIIRSLAAAATEMQATSQQMTSASQNTSNLSRLVAEAATQADGNVQIVASAAEELSATSHEIAQQISNVSTKSSRASQEAETTSQQVQELNTLADSIGDVISSIKEIAEQTNLLALNATIEAARAGDAGKGFAVVADEVKKLATETASKTIQIDERVGRIQTAIRSSVDAVARIISDVREIDHATSAVAGAVEEQNAATAEIGRNVAETSSGTQQVATNIAEVQQNAEQTSDSASALNDAASELAQIAETLQLQVTEFLKEIRES